MWAAASSVTTTLEAIYENGVLKLSRKLPLPDKTLVKVTIESSSVRDQDTERCGWLEFSEQTLTLTWGNPDDDVFNELLAR